MDPRLKQLSYSSRLKLHECPQAYRLYKLQNPLASKEDILSEGSITLQFGKAVGTGIQRVLCGWSETQWLMEMFANWECDLLSVDEKRKKSFWYAVIAVQKFAYLRSSGLLLKGYEVLEWEGKPAIELGFCITLPDGFKERGYLDAALHNPSTGAVAVLEAKTTWFTVNPAMYKNSSQAIGYSVVLDKVVGAPSDYTVYYPVYKTTAFEWEVFPFNKRFAERAAWLQEILYDIQDIQRYEETGHYPRRGESCFKFNRECKYFGSCTLSIQHLTTPLAPGDEEKLADEAASYQIQVTFEELLQEQLDRTEHLASPEYLSEVQAVSTPQNSVSNKFSKPVDLSTLAEDETI